MRQKSYKPLAYMLFRGEDNPFEPQWVIHLHCPVGESSELQGGVGKVEGREVCGVAIHGAAGMYFAMILALSGSFRGGVSPGSFR